MLKKVLPLALLWITGCTSLPYQPYAREVMKKPRVGGSIALHTDYRPEDRSRADYLMAANCGDDATANVTQESENVVGQRSDTQANRYRDTTDVDGMEFGGLHFGDTRPSVNTNATTETVQIKEWRIDYTCVPNGPMAAPQKKKSRAK